MLFTRICRKIGDVEIYALYPESFCGENLAIGKVFAFSYSGVWAGLMPRLSLFKIWRGRGLLGPNFFDPKLTRLMHLLCF